MSRYHSDPWLTVYQGDCREVMASMEPESVHCVVTSPPYWGLRDYGTATWIGGDEGCDHSPEKRGSRFATPVSSKQGSNTGSGTISQRDCPCGAVRQDSQLGLEPTPEEYVANMVAVFREVRRVLRADGTVWLNLGDSYATGQSSDSRSADERARSSTLGPKRDGLGGDNAAHKAVSFEPRPRQAGLAQKQLVGIPWRVAFALQADGWYLRSDIIWSKPNPMPESVTDRPTKAHEYLFLLSKRPTYYFDADAVREPASPNTHSRGNGIGVKNAGTEFGQGIKHNADYASAINGPVSARNLRSVWSIATQPYPGAHFATFPEALVEPCVKAGTSERGVCPECGAPWVRETSSEFVRLANRRPTRKAVQDGADMADVNSHDAMGYNRVTTTGWRRSCGHEGDPAPATVLDMFAGSGTTGRVAQRLGRRAVLIDLSGEYLTQAMRRNADIPLGLETA